MKPTLLTIVAALLTLAVPLSTQASLGGDVTSVRADQAKLQATVHTTAAGPYTVEEVKAPMGVVVREYVSSAGKVFAVAWQGPTHPDLQQLLGSYFQVYKQALQTQKPTHLHRAPIFINESGLVLEMGGHMRFLVGRAYIPSLVPTNVQMEEIR